MPTHSDVLPPFVDPGEGQEGEGQGKAIPPVKAPNSGRSSRTPRKSAEVSASKSSTPSEFKPPKRRVPSVLQMEAVECGGACLGMILGYYGKYIPLEELRIACGVSRDGSKAINIIRAARTYGLIAQGERVDANKLGEKELPGIIFWQNRHFMVLEGGSRGRILATDPASGTRVLTPAELAESYSGILLTFKPGPDFQQSGAGSDKRRESGRPSVLSSVQEIVRGSEDGLLYLIIVSTMMALPSIIVPALLRVFVDKVLEGRFFNWLGIIIVAIFTSLLLRTIVTWLHEYCVNCLRHKLALIGSTRFVWHVLRLPMDFFAARYRGDIAARVSLNDTIADTLALRLAGRLSDAVSVAILMVVMFIYDPMLTLVGLFAMVFFFVVTRRAHLTIEPTWRRLHQAQSRVLGTLTNGLASVGTVKATGQESYFFDLYNGHRAEEVNLQQQTDLSSELLSGVLPLTTVLTQAIILIVGGHRFLQGDLTLGSLIAFLALIYNLLPPMHRLADSAAAFRALTVHLQRVNDVLNHRLDIPIEISERRELSCEEEEAGTIDRIEGRVEFRNVTFGYSRLEPPLIQDFCLSLQPGQRVAIVGSSGCGKSTIAKLLIGLYEPWSGEILIDGRQRTDYSRAYLAGAVAAVDQEPLFMHGTIRENLTLWDFTIPHAAIVRACKDSIIHDSLSVRDKGYDGIVEEGGDNFSGGERQRMEIARALIRQPCVLILDEATSAVDPLVETQIDDRLRMRGCTCLIIAHRLSTIRDADEILVLEKGHVVQRGRHDDLKDQVGLYARLLEE